MSTISFYSRGSSVQTSSMLNLDRLLASSISNKGSRGSQQTKMCSFSSLDRLQTNHTQRPIKVVAKGIRHSSKVPTKAISNQDRAQISSIHLLDSQEACSSYTRSLDSKLVSRMVNLDQLKISSTLHIPKLQTSWRSSSSSSIHKLLKDFQEIHSSILQLHKEPTSTSMVNLDSPSTLNIPNLGKLLQATSIHNPSKPEASRTTSNLDSLATSNTPNLVQIKHSNINKQGSLGVVSSSTPQLKEPQITSSTHSSSSSSQDKSKTNSAKHLVSIIQTIRVPLVASLESIQLVKIQTLLGALLTTVATL